MIKLIKANGEVENFSEEKLRASIQRAGVPHSVEDEVVAHVTSKLHEGMRTSELYKHILEFLDKPESSQHRARYSLKQSIMDLGPTGFPFEKFVSRVLEREGYNTITNVIAAGKCVTHEVDVVATKKEETIMVEAKFHNGSGIKTEIHVSLYTQARFEDTKEKNHYTKAMLTTNTKATSDAIAYAQCVGMKILTWSYPQGKGLRELIEAYHLHPITSLQSFPNFQKQKLLQQNIVLCSELVNAGPSVLTDLPQEKRGDIIAEAKMICSHPKD